jgi:hypothetical protein
MLINNSKGATPANAGMEARRARKRRGKSPSRRQEDTSLKAVKRKIQKREAEKPVFAEFMRESAPDVSNEEIERFWNQCQLTAALLEARYERQRFLALNYELRELVQALAAIDRGEEIFGHTKPASDKSTDERRAAIAALRAIQEFLFRTRRAHSTVLKVLQIHLQNVEHGAGTPDVFGPSLTAGRKPDNSYLQSLKGYLAGMAFVQMESGMSRPQAVSWVARNIPSDLSRRISSKPIISSTVEEWMNQCGVTLKTRRELKSIITLDMKVERLVEFISTRYRSSQIDGGFGQLACLRMIYFGHKCLVAKDSVPFSQLFELFREEWDTPMLDAQIGRGAKHDEVSRLFARRATTQLGRLYFVGELTETQVQAGELVGRVYGQFERVIGAPQRHQSTPHYERAYKQAEIEKF